MKARFEREAKAISSLNHPHICTLYDVGQHNGTDYLVMEYLEGVSLADRLKRGPLPLQELLQIGCDIADALDRAHRAGIIHRDLKPANVMLTKSGAKLKQGVHTIFRIILLDTHQVRAILTNPKYNGAVVYGRVSKKLATYEVRVPSCEWVVTPRAFEPVIDDQTYAAAQRVLANRTSHKSNERLLDELRSILRKNGKLTRQVIRRSKGATSPNSYRPRFGSLGRAYELIGYRMPNFHNIETRRRIQTVRLIVMEELCRAFPNSVVKSQTLKASNHPLLR